MAPPTPPTAPGAPAPPAPSSTAPSAVGNKAPRRSSGKQAHSRSYPRGVGLDFRKLAGLTLLGYIDHHGTYPVSRVS